MGTLSFSDDRKYVGEWKSDKQHGKGSFYMSSGHVKEGIWENGKRIGDVPQIDLADTSKSVE